MNIQITNVYKLWPDGQLNIGKNNDGPMMAQIDAIGYPLCWFKPTYKNWAVYIEHDMELLHGLGDGTYTLPEFFRSDAYEAGWLETIEKVENLQKLLRDSP